MKRREIVSSKRSAVAADRVMNALALESAALVGNIGREILAWPAAVGAEDRAAPHH
jgi:hypothetical protein